MSGNLSTAIGLCRLLGLFPQETNSWYVRVAYRTYQVVIFSVMCLVSTSMTIQLFTAPDMNILARTIDMWTVCWTGLYKWFYLAVFIDEFRALHRLLNATQAQAIVVRGMVTRHVAIKRLTLIPIASNVYAFSGLVLAVFLSLGAMITYPKGNRSEFEYFNDLKSYPLCCWMPFTVINYLTFVSLWIFMFLVLLCAISMYLIIDTYFFGAIYVIGNQFDLLTETLSVIECSLDSERPADSSNDLFDEESQSKCYSLLSECIKHHGLILQCIRRLKNIFNTLIIFDYLHAVTSVTFAMFQTTTSIGLGERIALFTFIIVSLNHQFFNNFFGEYIIQKQISQHKAAYDFPWRCLNKKSRQLLTMIMCRSNKPLVISGFYMYKLCYHSFIAFVKALYTYYMVLRKVNLETKK